MRIKDFSLQYGISVENVLQALRDRKIGSFDHTYVLSDALVESLKKQLSLVDTGRLFKYGLSSSEKVVVFDMTVNDLAQKVQCSVTDLIVQLLKRGIFANKNQVL